MAKRHNVLLLEPMHAAGTQLLEKNCAVTTADSVEEDHLSQQVADVDAIVIRAKGVISQRVIESAPRLKVIGRHGVGLDNIDLQTAASRGIKVVYTPTANAQSVAEHFVGLAMILAKKIRTADQALRRGNWKVRLELRGTELQGKTLGVVGFGRVGRQTARICRNGFDMKVLYHDVMDFPDADKELEARRVDLAELLAVADLVSINVALTAQTRGLIDRELLKLMKPTAYIINMARGPVWNEQDLYEVLKDNRIAGAGSDVFETEPPPQDHPLFGLDNFVGTPHMAAHTQESLIRMSMVARDVLKVLEGEKPEFEVPESVSKLQSRRR